MFTGKYGEMRRRYLKDYQQQTYDSMVNEGTLEQHLESVDEECHNQISTIVEQLRVSWDIKEEYKDTDLLRWLGMINNAKKSAEEIVLSSYGICRNFVFRLGRG